MHEIDKYRCSNFMARAEFDLLLNYISNPFLADTEFWFCLEKLLVLLISTLKLSVAIFLLLLDLRLIFCSLSYFFGSNGLVFEGLKTFGFKKLVLLLKLMWAWSSEKLRYFLLFWYSYIECRQNWWQSFFLSRFLVQLLNVSNKQETS